ncbi:hypothetical protein SEVIR_6G137428v4 [Setaria viridis]
MHACLGLQVMGDHDSWSESSRIRTLTTPRGSMHDSAWRRASWLFLLALFATPVCVYVHNTYLGAFAFRGPGRPPPRSPALRAGPRRWSGSLQKMKRATTALEKTDNRWS